MTLLTLSVGAWLFAFVAVKIADHVYGGLVSALFVRYRVALHPGLVTFSTTRWNNRIESVARRHTRFLRLWFSVGVALGFVGLFLSVLLLSGNLASAILFGLTSPFVASNGARLPPADGHVAQQHGAIQTDGASSSPWAVFQHVFSPRVHRSLRNFILRHSHFNREHMLEFLESGTDPHSGIALEGRAVDRAKCRSKDLRHCLMRAYGGLVVAQILGTGSGVMGVRSQRLTAAFTARATRRNPTIHIQ
jgi:hypothetical protein